MTRTMKTNSMTLMKTKCGDEICVSEDILIEGGIECPACGENLEFDFSSLTAESINDEASEDE